MNETDTWRNSGLDLLCSICLFWVILQHSFLFTDFYFPKFRLLGFIGHSSLDLFLILSGFLIGGIIEKKYREKNSISLKNILKFYKRRWFKTVSMYFIIVIICLVVSHFDIYYAKFFTWDFLVFLQNLTVGDINFLSHINSLPIIYIAFKYLKPHSATESLLLIPALFIFVYSFGFICYHWIEKSIMDLRDK